MATQTTEKSKNKYKYNSNNTNRKHLTDKNTVVWIQKEGQTFWHA